MAISDGARNALSVGIASHGFGKELGDAINATSVLSGTEAGYLDGVTAGTAAASKALVLDATLDIGTIHDVTMNGNLEYSGATGLNLLTVPTNLADALSIVDSAGDLIVITTTTASQNITITPLLNVSNGIESAAQSVTPNSDSGAASTINAGINAVDVGAVTTDANDWIVLPSLADVPVGHPIKIACNAGTNFELRTPASSGEKINNVDSDGTQEYLCTDTDTVLIWKLSATDGWVAQSITALGAVRTAVVPD